MTAAVRPGDHRREQRAAEPDSQDHPANGTVTSPGEAA
jgi:hypothetical protein